MNATIVKQYFDSLERLLKAGADYAKAVKALIPEYNKASPEEKDAIRNRVAQAVGAKYGVKPKLMEKGSNKGLLGFDQYGSQSEKNARAFMRDNFKVTAKKKATATPKVSPKVDEAEALLKQLYSLSKKDQARFDVLYTNDKKASRK
jgi:hypothetical protein